MQFEATTWGSQRAPAPSQGEEASDRVRAPVRGASIELTGHPAAAAATAVLDAAPTVEYATTWEPAAAPERPLHAGRAAVDAAAMAALVAPLLDLLALAACLSVLRLWNALGIAWLAATFLALRDTASARPHRRVNVEVMNDLAPLATRTGASVLGLLSMAAAGGPHPSALGLLAVPAAVVGGRALACAAVRFARVRLGVLEPTVIVGTGEMALRLAGELCEHPEYGSQPIGFLDCSEAAGLPLPFLGSPRDLEAVADSLDVRRVVVADAQMDDAELVEVIRECVAMPAEVYLLPRFFELNVSSAPALTDQVRGIPLVQLPRRALRAPSWRLKRCLDVVLAALVLLMLAPLAALIALAVKLTSPGPVLYRQRRVGTLGADFELLKFRTMTVNGDGETTWSVRYDPRVTPLGALLRRLGLDELPQLVNVLRGEMSLVGPRPERPYFVDRFTAAMPGYPRRLRVPPGITGWAQVHGLRGDTSVVERLQFDNHYVDNWSLWRDLAIIIRTVLVEMRAGHG
jgi:exopolysaccharide biosynthesis polyprenyl glycosylphosphotransferase